MGGIDRGDKNRGYYQGMAYEAPSGLNVISSDAIKQYIEPNKEDMPIAIDVYDLYIQELTFNTEIKLTIEITLSINSILTKFVDDFKSTVKFSSDPTVRGSYLSGLLRDNEPTLMKCRKFIARFLLDAAIIDAFTLTSRPIPWR